MADLKSILDNYDTDDLQNFIMKKSQCCWEGRISQDNVDSWLSNFIGLVYMESVEKKLALIVLSKFIFITHEEVKHLCKDLLHELRHLLEEKGIDINNACYYPVGKPGESSSLIMYFFRAVNDIPNEKFHMHPRKEAKRYTRVFIDDIAITADQAQDYIDEQISDFDIDRENVYYINLISSNIAKEEFHNRGIRVVSSCDIDERMKMFSENSFCNLDDCLKNSIKHMLKGYENKIPRNPMGFHGSELLFGFFYNVPDNTLPIISFAEGGWKPIFMRYDKNYNKSIPETDIGGEVYV